MKEDDYVKTCEAVNKIFNERKKFIVIGLTGRTGSGCSTVASILKENDFKNLKLRMPKSYDFKNSEERKYSILYRYASAVSEAHEWDSFQVISVSDVISSFVFQNGYEEFASFLEEFSNSEDVEIHDRTAVLESIAEMESMITEVFNKLKEIDYEKKNDLDNSKVICEVYLELIPQITEILRSKLSHFKITYNNENCQLYTFLFQKFGNNIRESGSPFLNDFYPEHFFDLAERINKLIKAIKYRNKHQFGKPCFVCIDAIRNPFEATFFKERYSAFYLISVNTDDSSRRKRLSRLSASEIISLDKNEYPDALGTDKKFYHQDIASCLELADIHIYNKDTTNKDYYFLTKQILKYIVLIWHPGLITPTRTERCMQMAYNAKLNSGCLSRQVGAVVTDEDYSIKSVGWNDVPKGQVPCNLRDCQEYLNNKDEESYSNFEITDEKFTKAINVLLNNFNYSSLVGRKYPYCFKDVYNGITGKDNQVHTRALHAEENAFLQISKYGGMGIKDGFLFTTASPCELCSKKAYQLGIKKIYYIDPYPGISQTHILKFGNFNNPEMHLFYGAIGNAYISLYKPKMPFKDELEMLTGFKTKDVLKERTIDYFTIL